MALFHGAGGAMQTGMGLIPLTWQEIDAWARATSYNETLSPWELETIKRMSDAYASEYNRASDPKRPQPYKPVVYEIEIDRAAVAAQAESVLAQFKQKVG